MNDMQLRIIDTTNILNSSLTKHEKIVQICKCLSGLDITSATQAAKNHVVKHLCEMNVILSHYSPAIQSWEDYHLISEEHLNKILNSIKRLCKNLTFN